MTQQVKTRTNTILRYSRSEHVVHFQGFMNEKALTDEFEVFLRKEKLTTNIKYLHFYLDILSLKKTSKDDYDNFFNLIDKNYIQKNGEEFIDKFSIETKLKYYSNLKKFQMEKPYKEVPNNLYDEMIETVLNELKYESFPRFIRTTPCEKKLQNFLLNSEIVSPKEAVKFDYCDDDFAHCFVSDKDFDFTKALLNDGYHWELIGSANEENINTFWCNVNFMPKVTFLKGFKINFFF